jgi:drug/metabolite transporter (DMT)-like permease
MITKWASVIGLVLTAGGIIAGFYLPTIAARWSGPETLTQEFWLQLRFAIGVGLILLGTAFQVYGAWPR